MLAYLRSLLSSLFHRTQIDAELDEELRAHISRHADDLERSGLPRPEAERQARIAFGGYEMAKENCREQQAGSVLETLWRDLRFAARMLRKTPAFSLTVILILALGIGANTAVFTLAHAVLLKSLPVAKPQQLFRVGDNEQCCVNGGLENSWSLFSYDLYKHLRESTPAFQHLAAFQSGPERVAVRVMHGSGIAESRTNEFVSGNYFQMFGVGAFAGRIFTDDDDHPGASAVAVLSYRAWKEKYRGDPAIAGAAVAINGQPFTIVGIAPPGFFGAGLRSNPPEVWIPLSFEPVVNGDNSLLRHADEHWLNVMGRLAPDAQPKSIETQLTTALRQWLLGPSGGLTDDDRKHLAEQVIRLAPGGSGVRVMRENYEDSLMLLLWVTGAVLLIACANLANLLLARAVARHQEFSIRAALGASQVRLIRQAFSETLLLSLLGAAGGLFVAIYGTASILHLAFPHRYVPIDVTPSWPVLAFTFALSLLTALLSGLVPAWLTSRSQPVDALRTANRSTEGHSHWVQPSLVVLQSALSLVLICAAGLVVQSLRNMRNQPFGFQTDGRFIVEFDPQMAGYKPQQLNALYHQIRDGLQQITGVRSVSYSMYTPMSGRNWEGSINIEGHHGEHDQAAFVRVGPAYFATLGTRILQGRPIADQDSANSQAVAVVNQQFVKQFLGGKDPLGHHIGPLDEKHPGSLEIVGVTEDTNYWAPDEPIHPMYFVAAPQPIPTTSPEGELTETRSLYMQNIVVHTSIPVPDLEKQIRRVLGQINPDLPVMDFFPFSRLVENQLDQQQMIAQLMTVFGLLALILATVGLYGVTSFGVAKRTNEVGIRMALGANRSSVICMVMRAVAMQSLAGLLIGIPLTFAAGYILRNKLFGVRTFDLTVFAIAIFALVLSALIGGFFPARRAASIDPMQALRTE